MTGRMLVAGLIGAGLMVVGAVLQPFREPPRLVGTLTAVAYRGCGSLDSDVVAAAWRDALARWSSQLLAMLRPRPFETPAGCRVQAMRLARNLIVNAGENFLVDAWQNLVELEIMRYHGIGTGTAAPAETDTALQSELTTQYNPDNTRATGSLGEGAAPNVFRTVGTNSVDAAVAITEWGLFSQAATGGGTMWSRVTFAAINLASGDSLQTTYDLTVE